jgi:hypothetical protein
MVQQEMGYSACPSVRFVIIKLAYYYPDLLDLESSAN